MSSSAANTQGKTKHSYRLRHPASRRPIIVRPRRLETLEVLYGPGYPSDLDSGTKAVTRWKESHKRRLSAPRAARGASIEPLEVPAGWGAGRTDEHGMQRNQEVEVSNRSVDDNVIVIGGGARVSSVPERSPKVNSGSPSSNRELVGGECSYWACIPSKALLRPGEAVHRARGAAANARVDIEPALAWRDFMVNDYFDAGQECWLDDRASACCAVAAESPVLVSSRWMECATPPFTCCRDRRGSIRAARVRSRC